MPPTRWNRPPARWNRPPARRPRPWWRPALGLVLAVAAVLGTAAPPPAYGTHRPPAVEPAPAVTGDPTGRPAATGGPTLSGGVPDRTLTLLLANVGNSNAHCQPYAFKLCFRRVEARIARAIQQLRPDLIGLIEVWPDDRCATLYGGAPEPDPQKVCWRNPLRAAGSSGLGRPAFQVQRLVGPGYQIACDARFGWDCVAARDGRVRLAAVPRPGGFVLHRLETAPPVLGCDPGFTPAGGRPWPTTRQPAPFMPSGSTSAAGRRTYGWPAAATGAGPGKPQRPSTRPRPIPTSSTTGGRRRWRPAAGGSRWPGSTSGMRAGTCTWR